MHRRSLAPLLVAVAVVAVSPADGGTAKASLRVVRDLPLTLRGTGFRGNEAVHVRIVMGEKRLSQDTRAAAGSFTVTFRGVRLAYCKTPFTISARGARTGTVLATIPPRDCAPE